MLDRCRTIGGGMVPMPNPIAYSEIVAYARANQMDVEELVTIVQMLDGEVLRHMREAVAPKGERGKRRATQPRRPRRRGPR